MWGNTVVYITQEERDVANIKSDLGRFHASSGNRAEESIGRVAVVHTQHRYQLRYQLSHCAQPLHRWDNHTGPRAGLALSHAPIMALHLHLDYHAVSRKDFFRPDSPNIQTIPAAVSL